MTCEHLKELVPQLGSGQYVCEECIKADGRWIHLRVCQTCGATLCCDSSPAQHMTRHFQETGHPVAISAEPGERWAWCYEDREFIEF